MQNFKISIIGTGAIGGYYGGLLAKSGNDVHFLLKSDYQYVVENGLKVDSGQGGFHLKNVNCTSSIDKLPPSDLLVLSAKTTHNHEIFPVLHSVLKPEGVVLIFQNGFGLEESLTKFIKPEKIFGGACFICAHKSSPGHIRHLDYGLIKLGQYQKPPDCEHPGPMLEKLAVLFSESEVPVQLIENLILERWKKLVWNIPYNGLSVLLQLPTDRIMSDTRYRARAELLMREVASMADVCGYNIESSFIVKMLEATQKMISYKPSMLLDFEKGNPLEIETMYAVPLEKSIAAGYLPVEVKKLYSELIELNRKKLPVTS